MSNLNININNPPSLNYRQNNSYRNSLNTKNKNQLSNNKQMKFNSEPQKNRLPKAHTFFTHYSNALYMGQMKAFKRHGKGILLHDNGLSGIVNSTNNSFRGHNVLFGQNSITSINFIGEDCQIVYKNGKTILVNKLKRKDQTMILDGIGYLIQYDLQRVYKIVYQNDQLLQKILLDVDFGRQIFQNNNLNVVMKEPHISAMEFIFQAHPEVKVNRQHDEIKIGFRKKQEISPYLSTYKAEFRQKNGYDEDSSLQGVGIILQILQYDPDRPVEIQFKYIERGIYENGKLQFFGQKYFPNGNFYYGQILDKKMHGLGLLFQRKQQKWISGVFEDDRLVQTQTLNMESSSQQHNNYYYLMNESDRKKLQKTYRQLHSYDPKIWIDQMINSLPSEEYLQELLKILKFEVLTSSQAQKKLKKLQKQLKLQKLLLDISQSEDSPSNFNVNTNLKNILPSYSQSRIQQDNLLNNSNNISSDLNLQNKLKPIQQQRQNKNNIIHPGTNTNTDSDINMKYSFNPKNQTSANLNKRLNYQQFQRGETNQSENQTIINQLRPMYSEKDNLKLSDKKILNFNKLAEDSRQKNKMQQRVSWFIPSGNFQSNEERKSRSRSKSSQNKRSRQSSSSYQDSLQKLRRINAIEAQKAKLSNKKYTTNTNTKPLGTQHLAKTFTLQNSYLKQHIYSTKKPSSNSNSKSPIKDLYLQSQNRQNKQKASQHQQIYKTVGKFYSHSRSNNHHLERQEEFLTYKEHIEVMNQLAHTLSRQKSRRNDQKTTADVDALINHLVLDDNIKKYEHKSYKKNFNYLDKNQEMERILSQNTSPYRERRAERSRSISRSKSPAPIYQGKKQLNNYNYKTAIDSNPHYKVADNKTSAYVRQYKNSNKVYSDQLNHRHIQPTNDVISFNSSKQQNTPLKDLGKLLVKKQTPKNQKSRRQQQAKFMARMKNKQSSQKSHFIQDNAIFWSNNK